MTIIPERWELWKLSEHLDPLWYQDCQVKKNSFDAGNELTDEMEKFSLLAYLVMFLCVPWFPGYT